MDEDQPRSARNTLRMFEKIRVIQEYESSRSLKHLVAKYQCSRSQIQRILREKDAYLAEWAKNGDGARIRKSRPIKLIALGVFLYEWVQRCQCYAVEITDNSLKKNALAIAEMIGCSEFKANNRFTQRFKKKYKFDDAELADANRPIALQSDDSTRKCTKLAKIIEDVKMEVAANAGFSVDKILDDEVAWRHFERKILTGQRYNNVDNFEEEEKLYDSYSSESNADTYQANASSNFSINSTHSPEPAKEITNYREALNHLGPLEQFALFKENIRAIGLINQLENIFRDNMPNSS